MATLSLLIRELQESELVLCSKSKAALGRPPHVYILYLLNDNCHLRCRLLPSPTSGYCLSDQELPSNRKQMSVGDDPG